MTFIDFYEKYKSLIITIIVSVILFILGIIATWRITLHYSKKNFKDWQIKVATATAANIKLELKTCDRALRTIGEKADKIKSRNAYENEITLEYFDTVKNQMVNLKDIINNSKSHWDIMFPEFKKEYAEEVKKVEAYDRELLGIVVRIKELDKRRILEEDAGETAKLKETINQLQKTISLYEGKLQSYNELPVVYPSSVATADSVTNRKLILPDGNIFASPPVVTSTLKIDEKR